MDLGKLVGKPGPTEDVKHIPLNELFLTHMLQGYDSEQLDVARNIVAEKIKEGEKHLQEIYKRFAKAFLRSDSPELRAFTNYHTYLRFLYDNRPQGINGALSNLEGREADMVNIYRTIDPKTRKNERRDGYAQQLKQKTLYIEAAYSDTSRRPAGLIIVRRKDTDRAIMKIAYRLLLNIIYEEEKKKGKPIQKVNSPKVTDWFGLKLVADTVEQAHELFNTLYPNLNRFNLKPDIQSEPCVTKEGVVLVTYQPPGVDDHYLYGQGNNKLIQIKIRSLDHSLPDLREIAITDYGNLLVGEMDHVRFRQARIHELEQLLKRKRCHKNRFKEFVRRGQELTAGLPKKRRKILGPRRYFK